MALPSWPETLPAPQLRSYEEQTSNVLVRTDMDVGPAKVRRRVTAGVRAHKLLFAMTKDQVATFDAFLEASLAGGSSKFTMAHPRTGETVTWRITPPAKYTVEDTVWWVAIDAEQMPA